MRRAPAILVVLLGLFALRADAAFGDVYEPDEAAEAGDFEAEAELDDAELDSIDSTVESLAASFTEQVKHHIQEQVKARKLSTSKFSQSRVAIQHSSLVRAALRTQNIVHCSAQNAAS